MSERPLVILTGPPGAGKSTYASTKLNGSVFDQNLGNKSMWRDNREGATVLVTAAPDKDAKHYWLQEARRFGFAPRIIVLDPGMATTTQRLLSRELETTEGQRRRLSRTVQRWYAAYSPHPEEVKVET